MSGEDGTIFYLAQEAAFAPGIVGEWPIVIPHPRSKNGRLVKCKTTLQWVITRAIVMAWECDEDISIMDIAQKVMAEIELAK